jgi:rhodanese-related sulfurtransferase
MSDLPEIQGYKPASKNLLIIVVSVAVLILLGLVFMKRETHKYTITSENMLKQLLENKHVITPEMFMDIYFNKDSSYRFIDLRSSPEYLKGHLDNAVHIPLHKILDKENEKILNQDEKINILYHSDHCRACGPWMVLTQIGYKNNRILLGGYDYVKKYILDDYSPMSGGFSEEKAKYDYSKIVNETSGSAVSSEASSNQNPVNAPVIKKDKKSSGGGC